MEEKGGPHSGRSGVCQEGSSECVFSLLKIDAQENPFKEALASVFLLKSLKKFPGIEHSDPDECSKIQLKFCWCYFVDDGLTKERLNTYVVSASIGNTSIQNLNEPVTITLQHTDQNMGSAAVHCVFQDFQKNNGLGGWNTSGCEIEYTDMNYTICFCNHLTHFGVLPAASILNERKQPLKVQCQKMQWLPEKMGYDKCKAMGKLQAGENCLTPVESNLLDGVSSPFLVQPPVEVSITLLREAKALPGTKDVTSEGRILHGTDFRQLGNVSIQAQRSQPGFKISSLLHHHFSNQHGYRKLWRDNPSKILLNLCTAPLMLNMVFLTNSWLSSFNQPGLGITVAVLLLCFLLAAFKWMCLESVHSYLALVKVFNVFVPKDILKCHTAGWGIPAIVITVVLTINKDFYGNGSPPERNPFSNFGWIRENTVVYTSVVAYVLSAFLKNSAMFIPVLLQIHSLK